MNITTSCFSRDHRQVPAPCAPPMPAAASTGGPQLLAELVTRLAARAATRVTIRFVTLRSWFITRAISRQMVDRTILLTGLLSYCYIPINTNLFVN